PLFTNDKLPGVEAFDHALAVLATEQDINPGTDPMQAKVRAIATLARNEAERNRIDRVIREQSWGLKQSLYVSGKDWVAPRVAGNYGTDWRARTAANMYGMWSNSKSEVATFEVGGATPIHGSETYIMSFERDDLPASRVRYFWSLCCVN